MHKIRGLIYAAFFVLLHNVRTAARNLQVPRKAISNQLPYLCLLNSEVKKEQLNAERQVLFHVSHISCEIYG